MTEPQVSILVGRTATGFLRFLEEEGLKPVDPVVLAEYVRQSIVNFSNDDVAASRVLLGEIWGVVGVSDDLVLRVEVTRQFGRLCDMYKTLMGSIIGPDRDLAVALRDAGGDS